MKAIGKNLIVKINKQGVSETKGGLFLAEKQREDIRYTEGVIVSAGSDVTGIKQNDVIYFVSSTLMHFPLMFAMCFLLLR